MRNRSTIQAALLRDQGASVSSTVCPTRASHVIASVHRVSKNATGTVIRPSNSTLEPTGQDRVASSSLDLRVRLELLDIAARSGIVAAFLTIAVALFTDLLLLGPSRPSQLAGWTLAMLVVSAARIGVCTIWRRERDAEHPGGAAGLVTRWERIHVLVAFCCGLAWASLAFLVVHDVERTALLVGFGLTIALVSASNSFSTNRLAVLAFALPVVVAQIINLQHLVNAQHTLIGVAWLALMAVLFFMPRVSSLSLREGLIARIEHERHASEQTALLDTAPLGILVVRDERIVICNDALLKMLGYARKEDLLGKSIRVLIPDDEAWQQVVRDAALAMKGPVAAQIVRRLRGDGSVIDVLHNMAAVRGGSGEAEYIDLYEDVQDRIATEEGFQHAVRMQRLVFESAGEGIAIVNDGIIEQANQALSDLIGLPVSRLTDRPLQSIFEDPQGWAEIERRFQRLGNTLKLERRVVRSDGRVIWVNVTGCLVDAPPEEGGGRKPVATAGAVKRSIWILADLSVQKQKEAENWHHANHDVMTGLPNRRFLQDRLDQALAFARRDGRRVAVLELDLDGFKSINDTYGHRFGDAVLEEVARRLSTVVRELDTVGRWGGDEFVLVLKDIESREVVEETVKRVIARLSEPIVYMGQNLSIGASIGIALFPDHGDEVEALMLAADLAMYESKGSGGNTWRFASPATQGPRGKYRPAATPVSTTDR